MDGRVSVFDDISYFYENGNVLLQIRLLTNTNIAWINFFMTKHGVVSLIIDIESVKSDVNGRKKKYMLFGTLF